MHCNALLLIAWFCNTHGLQRVNVASKYYIIDGLKFPLYIGQIERGAVGGARCQRLRGCRFFDRGCQFFDSKCRFFDRVCRFFDTLNEYLSSQLGSKCSTNQVIIGVGTVVAYGSLSTRNEQKQGWHGSCLSRL